MNKPPISKDLIKNFIKSYVKSKVFRNPRLDPFILAYFVTFRCNLQCSYCSYSKLNYSTKFKELDTSKTKEILRICREIAPSLAISGGEPLIREDITDIVKHAKELKYKPISLFTNSLLLPDKEEILEYVDFLQKSWTGFSIYFPSASWGPDNISKEIVFQLHGSADSGEPSKSPPLSLKVDLGSIECYWQVRWDENLISNSAQPTGPGAGVADIWRGPIDKDQWTDWIIHAKWDYANDGIGFMEIWRNGEKVATRNGPNMFNYELGMRGPIFGIYKWDWKKGPSDVTERIIYHDEFRDYDGTASFANVDPAQSDI